MDDFESVDKVDNSSDFNSTLFFLIFAIENPCCNQSLFFYMKKIVTTLIILCAAFLSLKAQYKESEALFGTQLTYEISNSKGEPWTAEMLLCKSEQGYYNASKYSLAEDRSESSFLVFYMGGDNEIVDTINQLNELIVNSTSGFETEIKDAKGTEFILSAPKDGNRIGTYLILQKKGEEDWGVISKQHLKNMLRMI